MNQVQQAQLFPPGQSGPGAGAGNLTGDMENLRSTFIQNVSHEFRTPLGIIHGYAELLYNGAMGTLSPEQEEATFVIVNRAHELRTMVERIGILLAIESNATISMPLMLSEVATTVVERKRADATQAGIELAAHLEPDLPLVSGDPYQLEQAVDCLVDNALKFTPAGGRVEVQVYAGRNGRAGSDWISLEVTDTGIGIPGQELQRIFTGFYQVDGSTTRQCGGLGLGLTVVQAVVKEHGGQIEVESQPDQGSRFVVSLPALPAGVQVEQPIGIGKEEGATLQNILIVDDEEYVALTLQEALEKLPNCKVAVATCGQQALELFERQPFDLLITDYKMPGIDGMTLAARVRELYPQTAIVVITAYNSETLREQAARASVRRILDKPVGIAEIRTVASEALAQSA